MTDLDIFKRRVGYRVKAEQDTQTCNGADRVFNLRRENVFDVVVMLDDAEADPDSYTVVNEAGKLTFITAPADGVVITVNYSFAPYTDAEAESLITAHGLNGAVIEALREILADSARRTNYQRGDTQVSDSDIFKQVKQLLDMYVNEEQKLDQTGVSIEKRKDPRGDGGVCGPHDVSRLYG